MKNPLLHSNLKNNTDDAKTQSVVARESESFNRCEYADHCDAGPHIDHYDYYDMDSCIPEVDYTCADTLAGTTFAGGDSRFTEGNANCPIFPNKQRNKAT